MHRSASGSEPDDVAGLRRRRTRLFLSEVVLVVGIVGATLSGIRHPAMYAFIGVALVGVVVLSAMIVATARKLFA